MGGKEEKVMEGDERGTLGKQEVLERDMKVLENDIEKK